MHNKYMLSLKNPLSSDLLNFQIDSYTFSPAI